ncbi:MAG: carboxypeptidase regulatory-like domain-containing protein [Candidatus Aminicenantes bacterium]|nr:carboxypeptidase regulatory-like domain-containing protein [Candidatus Aminicenantes bacterium]
MKGKSYFIVIFLLYLTTTALALMSQDSEKAESITISGRVSDFEGQPIEGASVFLKDDRFNDIATAISDKDGVYSMTVPKGRYMSLVAVKDYQVKYLEYWAWSVPAFKDLKINPRFDRMEVYAMNAWRPQGAYPSYQIYFRPMSLSMAKTAIEKAGGMEKLNALPVIDIAPKLEKDNIEVTIDNRHVQILEINRVREASGSNQYMFGYLIQVALPEKTEDDTYSVITITLSDPETGEKGEGCLFVRSQNSD